jgi:TldD protein
MTLVAPELAERVLARALERGGDFAELYTESRHGFGLSLDDGRIEHPQGGRERGACVRVVQGESTYYGHVDGLAEPDLLRVAGSAAQAVRGDARRAAALSAAAPAGRHPVALAPEVVEAARKAELLRACNDRARSAGAEVTQVRLGYAESRRQVEIFNSEGHAASDDRTRVRLSAQVVARRGERVETGTDTRGGHAGFELLEQDPEEVAALAARRALTLLDAVDAPTGRLPVVVGNGFGGVLLHEAVGHGLEADAVQKGASVYAGRMGDQLCEDFVTAYDDGSREGEWGSDGVDDEGTLTQRTTIIEDGRLTSYLYDLLTARRDGAGPTGNGRRESFRHLPVPRMTNTFFAPGDASSDDLIGEVERGLYAVSFGGGQVEPATGDFVFGVSEGYLIEGGKVTAPVRGATLVGNGLEALRAVDGVAEDLTIATGYCGKAGQTVPAGVGQPHVRLRELTVGGTAS